mgnify:CR=1 FL=1
MTEKELKRQKQREYYKKWYKANKKEILARQAEYRAANREQILVKKAEYRAANREQIAAKQAEYYVANREQIAAKHAEYYTANRERLVTKKAEYYAANKEQILAKKAEYYAANKEQLAAKKAKYNAANRERIAAKSAEYYTANKEQIIAKNAEYRYTPKGRASHLANDYKRIDKEKGFDVSGNISTNYILKHIFTQPCYYCGIKDWREIGADRIDNSKPHTPDNVLPCCGKCNIVRSDRMSVAEMKAFVEEQKRLYPQDFKFEV